MHDATKRFSFLSMLNAFDKFGKVCIIFYKQNYIKHKNNQYNFLTHQNVILIIH